MAFLDRSRLEKRMEVAARVAYLWASLGTILVVLLWVAGVDFQMAVLGIGLAGGIALAGYFTERGSILAGAALVLLGAASVVYAFQHRPFTVDLLGAAALFFFLRGFLAARELRDLETRMEEERRRKAAKAEEKAAGKGRKGKPKRKRKWR